MSVSTMMHPQPYPESNGFSLDTSYSSRTICYNSSLLQKISSLQLVQSNFACNYITLECYMSLPTHPLCFVIPLEAMACQPLFSSYIIGRISSSTSQYYIFSMISKYIPSHRKLLSMLSCCLLTNTLNTATQYYILEMSVPVALLPCHQLQLITP
jgi:hypothetical protein